MEVSDEDAHLKVGQMDREAQRPPIFPDLTKFVIVGATRGIGREMLEVLLQEGHFVIGTHRTSEGSLSLSDAIPQWNLMCDMTSEQSIKDFGQALERLRHDCSLKMDYLIVNAGVLKYPNRATEVSYSDFLLHMKTNCIGPILTAQTVLNVIPLKGIIFISSDSGSASQFNDFEDGFAAYAASKAALNQALRHMAAELKRKGSKTWVIALHPGEVKTDMADIDVSWEVEGQIGVEESVRGCLGTIADRGPEDNGTFWRWDNTQHPW